MNRIRNTGKTFQTLITPHQKYDTGFEYLLGSWTDDAIMGFEVREYKSYYDAECEAVNHPDINWDQLIDYHKDAYMYLKDHIQKLLYRTKICIQFKSQLMTPEQTKNTMFDRVLKGQQSMIEKSDTSGFRTVYNMNDIINFSITNPWSKNLAELELRLIQSDNLKIFNRIEKNTIVHLIGRTDIGTTYEIVLAPTILNNWMEWKVMNKNMASYHHLSALNNCIKTQKMIDMSPVLR
jgi:hypothetical protein